MLDIFQEWGMCEFKDSESCNPATELDIPFITGLAFATGQGALKVN